MRREEREGMKKILVVGVDSSPRAPSVLAAARLMADRLDASVVLIGAIEGLELQSLVPPELAAWDNTSIWRELEKQAQASVEKAAALFRPQQVIERRVEPGPAWRLICDAATKHRAALVVVGAHAYRPIERMLGTTAAKVANRADCSVLVVRGNDLGFERITIGHDGSPRAANVVAAARLLAAPSGGRLTLARAVHPTGDVTSSVWGKKPDELMAMFTQLAKTELEQIRGALPHKVPAETEARVGSASDVVLDVARAKEAQLIVVGSHGFDMLDRVLGTTSARIANAADRSVLVVRGDALAS